MFSTPENYFCSFLYWIAMDLLLNTLSNPLQYTIVYK